MASHAMVWPSLRHFYPSPVALFSQVLLTYHALRRVSSRPYKASPSRGGVGWGGNDKNGAVGLTAVSELMLGLSLTAVVEVMQCNALYELLFVP